MTLLEQLDIGQLGVAGIIVGILVWENMGLRKDLKEERDYSRKLADMNQQTALKTLDTLKTLEQAITLLGDRLKS